MPGFTLQHMIEGKVSVNGSYLTEIRPTGHPLKKQVRDALWAGADQCESGRGKTIIKLITEYACGVLDTVERERGQ